MIITDGTRIAGIAYKVDDGCIKDFTDEVLDDILTCPKLKGTERTRAVEDVDYCIDNLKDIVWEDNNGWEEEGCNIHAYASYVVKDLVDFANNEQAELDLMDLGY